MLPYCIVLQISNPNPPPDGERCHRFQVYIPIQSEIRAKARFAQNPSQMRNVPGRVTNPALPQYYSIPEAQTGQEKRKPQSEYAHNKESGHRTLRQSGGKRYDR